MSKRMRSGKISVLCLGLLLFALLVPVSIARADEPARTLTVIKPQGGVFTYTKTDAEADVEYVLYAVDGIDSANRVLSWDALTAELKFIDQKKAEGTSLSFIIPQNAITENGTFYIGDGSDNTCYAAGFLTRYDEVWEGDASAFYFADAGLSSALRTEYKLLNDKTTEEIKKILPKTAYLKLVTKKPAEDGEDGTYLAVPVSLAWDQPGGAAGFNTAEDDELAFTASVTFPADSIEGRTGAAWAELFPVPELSVTVKGPDKPAPKPPQYHRILVQTGATAEKDGAAVRSARSGDVISISWNRNPYGIVSDDGYEFTEWDIDGAAPASADSPTTTFTMGDSDVTVQFSEKKKDIENESGEIDPEDRNRLTKVSSLKYPKTSLTLLRGSSVSNAAAATPPRNVSPADLPDVTYVTDNKDIVTVDKYGNFYAKGGGDTTVTAYCGDKKASCKVSVISPTEKVVILDENGKARKDAYNLTDQELTGWNDPDIAIQMKPGEKLSLRTQVYPADSTDPKNVTWSVAAVPSMVIDRFGNPDYQRDKNGNLVYKKDTKYVAVQNGVITAKETNTQLFGSVLVSATVKKSVIDPVSGKIKTVDLTTMVMVYVPPLIPEKAGNNFDKTHTLSLKKPTINMVTTDGSNTFDLVLNISSKQKNDAVAENYEIDCVSTNPNVASVVNCTDISQTDSAGKKGAATVRIRANNPGSAYITVKSREKRATVPNVQRCKVTVTRPVTGVAAVSGTLRIRQGKINVYDKKNRTVVKSDDDVKMLTMRKGSCGTIEALVTPYDATDLSKVKISVSGGLKIKNGVIYATGLTKPDKGDYGKVTVSCGNFKDIVYVTVTK